MARVKVTGRQYRCPKEVGDHQDRMRHMIEADAFLATDKNHLRAPVMHVAPGLLKRVRS